MNREFKSKIVNFKVITLHDTIDHRICLRTHSLAILICISIGHWSKDRSTPYTTSRAITITGAE